MSRQIVISARPEALALDPASSALIVVDMQNDFGSEGGMFALAGIDTSGIRAAIEPTARALDAAREAGIPVIYLKMGFQPDLSDAGSPDAPNLIKHGRLRVGETVTAPDGSASRILIRDTWNTEIVPELTPQAGDVVLYKTRFSGFYRTDLDQILHDRGIKTLIVTGCTTSVCVESTIRDAMFRDYPCLLLEDCTAEPTGQDLPRSNHEASLLLLETDFCWVCRSADLITTLRNEHAEAA